MILSQVVNPERERDLETLTGIDKAEAEERGESPNRRRPVSREQEVAGIIGAVAWRKRVTFLDVESRHAATFWLVFERPRIVCDVLPKGAKREQFEWRAEIARHHGYRWVAFETGAALDPTEIRRAAGKE